MANILYSGQTFPLSKDVDTDALAVAILDSCATGTHSWITLSGIGVDSGPLQLLVGPGIPVAIIDA